MPTVLTVTTDEQLARCLAIRRQVFIDEQGVDEALEIDGLDAVCTHFLAFPDDVTTPPNAVATARLRITDDGRAKAQRVAVLPQTRHAGYGRMLMHAIETQARHMGHHELILSAQISARPFYDRLEYQPFGETFLEAGIEHIMMHKALM